MAAPHYQTGSQSGEDFPPTPTATAGTTGTHPNSKCSADRVIGDTDLKALNSLLGRLVTNFG